MTTTEQPTITDTGTDAPMPVGDPVVPAGSVPVGEPTSKAEEKARAGWLPPRRSPNRPAAARAARKADSPPKPRATKDDATLKKALTELYTAGGMMLAPFDAQCGMAVVNSADPCADALVKLAAENDAVRRALSSLTQTSAWGGVIAAHLPIIMAVSAHHVAGIRDKMPNNVVEMNTAGGDEAPRARPAARRATRAADGFGRFCPDCNAALQKGVIHNCPNKGA